MSISLGPRRRKPMVATSTGTQDRVNKKIDYYANAQNQKQDAAIRADGVRMLVWNKIRGTLPCTCSTVNNPKLADELLISATDLNSTPGQTAINEDNLPSILPNPESPMEDQPSTLRITGLPSGDQYDKAFNPITAPEETPRELISGDKDDEWADFNANNEDDSLLDALADDEGAYGELDGFLDGGGLPIGTPSSVLHSIHHACPICYGSGFKDGWELLHGYRKVLDLSGEDNLSVGAVDVNNEERPITANLAEDGVIQWKVKLPKYWNVALRVQAYDGLYPLDVIPTWTTNTKSGLFTPEGIAPLNGSNEEVTVEIRNVNFNDRTPFSHIDIVLLMGDYEPGQVPHVDFPYDAEWLEFSTTMNIELTGSTFVKEGAVICESRYGRAWRATTVARRGTASGIAYGVTATVNNIQDTELYSNMNLFSKNKRDPKRLYTHPEQEQNNDWDI